MRGEFNNMVKRFCPKGEGGGACSRYMMNRNRHMRSVLKIHDEPESPHERAC